MRHVLSAILCVCLFSAPAQADELGEVSELLKMKVNAVMALLQNKTMDKVQRNDQIIAIVTPIFDYQAMAKLSLGKKHWPTLSEEQRAKFDHLFTLRLQESYLSKLDIYSDEEVIFGEPQTVGRMVHMPSTLISKQNRIEMLYKFYSSKTGWMIYDVEIGGVSIIQTYRSQFDEVLNQGSIDDLLEKLKTKEDFVIPAPDVGKARG